MQNEQRSSGNNSNRKLFVYEDGNQGARDECVSWTVDALDQALSWLTSEKLVTPRYSVGTITAQRIINDSSWNGECSLLVMPGGRDLPYCALLNGQGNQQIKSFVCDHGGSYLGICAGAYYACKYIEFEKHDPTMSICGPRELAFFDGVGRGSFYPGFDYHSRCYARAAPVILQHSITESHLMSVKCTADLCGSPIFAYFNGGCEFVSDTKVVACEAPETSTQQQQEQPQEQQQQQEQEQQFVSHVVAKYYERPDSSSSSRPAGYMECSSSSSSSISSKNSSSSSSSSDVEPLSAAVVLSECGRGRVALTGAHLEVGPECLEANAVNHAGSLPADVVSKLAATDRQRRRLFALLVHALLK